MIPRRKWWPENDQYFHEGVDFAQWCVSLVCKSLHNMFPHKSLSSSCFPAGISIGAYLTVETMVEFISMNSYYKLPASCRKHWITMPCLSSPQCFSLRWISLEEGWMNFALHHSSCVPPDLAGSTSLSCAPEVTVFWHSGTSWLSCEVLTSWCPLVAYSPTMYYTA